MATETAAAASSGRWSELPFDLLRDISHRLHVATDYVRFHAVCRSWRATFPPPARRPAFLPWLLARPVDDTGQRKARCVFFSKPMSRLCNTDHGLCYDVPDRAWVIAADDGAAAYHLPVDDESVDTFGAGAAASATLPPYPNVIKSWMNRASGTVSSDGTVFLHPFGLVQEHNLPIFTALLRPGDPAWTFVEINLFGFPGDNCCVAYHDGKIVLCSMELLCRGCWTIDVSAKTRIGGVHRATFDGYIDGLSHPRGYLVESRGELLWVLVHVNISGDEGLISSQLDALAVSVHTLQHGEADGSKPQWVQRDGRSFADRILFLGPQGSFAVDAARFGNSVGGGCAFFIDHMTRSRVHKYSFLDGSSELVEQLPEQWNDLCCMWLMPKPVIASTEEIREKLKPAQVSTTEVISSFIWAICCGR